MPLHAAASDFDAGRNTTRFGGSIDVDQPRLSFESIIKLPQSTDWITFATEDEYFDARKRGGGEKSEPIEDQKKGRHCEHNAGLGCSDGLDPRDGRACLGCLNRHERRAVQQAAVEIEHRIVEVQRIDG